MERVVFIEEIYDDVKETIKLEGFWEDGKEGKVVEEPETTIENLDSLLGVLEIVTFKAIVKYTPYHSIQTNEKGLSYILLHTNLLHKVQNNLTLTILRFVTWTLNNQYAFHLLKQCVLTTSNAVKFALLSQYQLVFEIFQHQGREELIEQLEEIFEIRQLIKKKVAIQVIEFPQHQRNHTTIASGQQQWFYFQITKPGSIVFFQLYVDIDITLTLTYLGGIHQQLITTQYLKQQKCKNKTFQILVNDCGLHGIKFDNSYSWMTAKNVVFSLNVLKPQEGDNDIWNLLVYKDQYTRWQREQGESEKEKQIIDIWKNNGKCDVVIWEEKVLFQGVVLGLEELGLSPQQLKGIKTLLIVGEDEQEYKDVADEIKEGNNNIEIRRCKLQ